MILSVTPNPCVDKTLFVDRMKPGHKTVAARWSAVPGGKGNNVARAVKALGHKSAAMVLVGGHTGRHVVDMIENDDGVRCLPVWLDGYTRTITTVLETELHRQTPLFEPGPKVSPGEVDALRAAFAAAMDEAQLVTLNGTIPDPAIDDVYAQLIAVAHERSVPVLLDAHGPGFAKGLAAKPMAIKPNQHEAEEILGFPLENEDAQWNAIEEFHSRGVELVIMSLGKDGALVSRAGERLAVRPPVIEEINAVGSGDALVGGFAVGLIEGRSLEEMAILGVACGTANAQCWDIGHFSAADVETVAQRVQLRRL